jgi:RimJ/RimL family protein N-acetyltransferase
VSVAAAVLAALPEPHVALRDARPEDSARVWEWNFAPDVRARSLDQRTVTFAQHARWYADRVADLDAPIWIVEADGVACGIVRLDWRSDGAGRISIALAPGTRGRGIGRRAIALACEAWRRPVIAEIRADNLPSLRAFSACGFRNATPPQSAASATALLTYLWRP